MVRASRVALLVAVSAGIAALSVTASKFPSPSAARFGLARVVALPKQVVRFAQLLESHCEGVSACSDRDLSVADGDLLVTGGAEGRRFYVWFRGRGKYLRGWLPAVNVKELPFDAHPASEKWEGTWTAEGMRKIVIGVDRATGELTVGAHAEWYGARLDNGEQIIHTGDVQGKAAPDGNRVLIHQDDCVLELELVDAFLGAADNMRCGGMNVSFSDVYART